MAASRDPFGARTRIQTPLGERVVYRLDAVLGAAQAEALPYSIKVLLEACLRNVDGFVIEEGHVKSLAGYDGRRVGEVEIPFMPGRVVLQDFTGVPAVVDLAAMRSGIVRMTGDESAAKRVNPIVPCDLVVDHSVQVDAFGSPDALRINSELEFSRNRERYELLKWAQGAFDNFRVVPPATGIVHQVNLEYLAKVVWDGADVAGQERALYPDSVVGTDSHTTMINGLGVLGWGVGGIEAEAVMLSQPIYMLIPEVVGVELVGRLPEGATATDMVLRVTELLRGHGVVGKFVEFHGAGLAEMPLANRATIANMAPEYGATTGFFPVDERTIQYLELSGRDPKLVAAVEQYCKLQGLWREPGRRAVYSEDLRLDLGSIEPSLAGPSRPQDRVALTAMKSTWRQDLSTVFGKPAPTRLSTPESAVNEGMPTADEAENGGRVPVELAGERFVLRHGSVVIAAITSCTNTSNPEVMLAAGLLARKARARGLRRKPWVKTSLAPGSKVVTEYFRRAGLLEDLSALGFDVVGYGCTTCIGNSGPLQAPIAKAVEDGDLVVAAVLSGNRNFEGRVNPHVRANYLASPPLCVAYALAGSVDVDLASEPLGTGSDGKPVYLREVWPSQAEVAELIQSCVSRDEFVGQYADVFEGSEEWRRIQAPSGALYRWDEGSTYVQEPPFFVGLRPEPAPTRAITGARCLAKLGDSVTTDHISPAGSIKRGTPAARYLEEHGVAPADFNSYGARRGNDRVMTRGTFANIRVRNQLAPGTEGGYTTDFTKIQGRLAKPEEASFVYDASVSYQQAGIPLVVLAGKDYGMGSSRDWAAKGAYLLGVRAVIAVSFERIHRSNLVGMGVLPLCFEAGQSHESLGLDGTESFDIPVDDGVTPRQKITVTARHPGGKVTSFATVCRIDTPVEVEYYRQGGILHTVLRKMARS
jgi:aconitate hydratase A / 2-methylisocitrate dehydratase